MPTTSTSKINFKIIDWMRGLAALYVVLNHSHGGLFTNATEYSLHVNPKPNWHWWEKLSMYILDQTNLGVEFVILFFILSGFSIAHSLNSNEKVLPFYQRRLVRLYPPYVLGIIWAIVAFMAIAIIAPQVFGTGVEGEGPFNSLFYKFVAPKSILFNLVYIPTNLALTPQYWSLPFEIIFYFLIPWLIRRFNIYGILSVLVFTIGWFHYGISFMDADTAPIFLQHFIDFNIFFVVGILLYRYRDFFIINYKIGKKTSILLLFVIFEITGQLKLHMFHQHTTKISALLMTVFSAIVIISGLKYQIRFKLLEKIGSFSYTLYVTHVATIYIIKVIFYKLGFGFYNNYSLYEWYFGIISSVLCAWGLYYLAEYPSINYLKKLRKRTVPAIQTP